MAAIQGTSHLIEMSLNGNLPGKLGRYLEIQKESLKTLGELVDQVLLLNQLFTDNVRSTADSTEKLLQ